MSSRSSLPRLFSPVHRRLVRFRQDERGATAIEFAAIAAPFFALLFAIIETALTLWATQVLENGVSDASRRLYTGQFQQANAGKDTETLVKLFRDEICKGGALMFSCDQIKIDVRPLPAFPNSRPETPITDGQFDANKFNQFVPPKPSEIAIVRAAVEIPVFVSLLNPKQANLTNGNRLIMATATFRAEPYSG